MSDSFPAIKAVLSAYRSTEAVITEEQITAAWAEYDALRFFAPAERGRIVAFIREEARGHRSGLPHGETAANALEAVAKGIERGER